MTPLLPVLAAVALTDPVGTDRGLLAAARRGRTLHLFLDTGRAVTPTGRVSRAARPLCGRRPRAWRPAKVDGRPLCRTCSRVLCLQYGPAALATAATWLQPDDLARTLVTAQDLGTVQAAVGLLLESGLTGKTARVDGAAVRLTQLAAQARTRLTPTPPFRDDPAFVSFVERAPARRFPRRVS